MPHHDLGRQPWLGLGGLLLRDIAGWQPAALGAAGGCVISAALTALALDRALASYADGVPWIRATPDHWNGPARTTICPAEVAIPAPNAKG